MWLEDIWIRAASTLFHAKSGRMRGMKPMGESRHGSRWWKPGKRLWRQASGEGDLSGRSLLFGW